MKDLTDDPAFSWCVRDVLKRRDRIISKVKSKYWKTTHEFSIELPHSVQEACEIDRRTDTKFWTKAIEKKKRKMSSSPLQDMTKRHPTNFVTNNSYYQDSKK